MLCSALSFGVRAFFGAKLMLAIDDCRLEMSERDSTAAAGSDDDDWWDGYSSSACPSLDDWERVGLTAWVPKSVATLALLYLLRRRRNAPQQVTQALRYGSGDEGQQGGASYYYADYPQNAPSGSDYGGYQTVPSDGASFSSSFSAAAPAPVAAQTTLRGSRKPHIQLVTQV